ncbi:MAG: AEC family transporter [Phycisphaeraceae bacterium]
MDPRTVQFLIFCVFSVASLAAGYAARRRNLVTEDFSRPLHFVTVVFLWSAVSLLSLWKLPLGRDNIWLLVIEPLLVAVPAYGIIPIARYFGCTRKQTGVLALAAGLGNLGFTLGGYLCYTLLANPELIARPDLADADAANAAADAALAYAVAQVTIMSTTGVVVLYPLARHFGDTDTTGESLATLIRRSLVDLRAMMIYTGILGVALAYLGVPQPAWIDRVGVIDVLFYLGAFTAYAGIGLRLRLGETWRHLRLHAMLAGMRFVTIPLLTLALVSLAALSPAPPNVLLRHVFLVEAFMPAAIQLVITANLFHLDPRQASSLWLVNTLLFLAVPLPVMIWLLG